MVSNAASQTSTKSARSDSGNGVKMFPSPPQLATPTDLKPEQVKAVVEAVNPLIADAYAIYLKTKNYHWHLSGSHFRDYHLLFQEQAESILDSVDPLAERMRRIGGTTIRSISHISHLQSISDDNSEFVPPDQIIQNLLGDNRHSAQRQREAIHICEENNDDPTANILEEVLDQTEKRIWFLFEVSQGGQNMK